MYYGYYAPHLVYCHQYLQCIHLRFVARNCSPGLHWIPMIGIYARECCLVKCLFKFRFTSFSYQGYNYESMIEKSCDGLTVFCSEIKFRNVIPHRYKPTDKRLLIFVLGSEVLLSRFRDTFMTLYTKHQRMFKAFNSFF